MVVTAIDTEEQECMFDRIWIDIFKGRYVDDIESGCTITPIMMSEA